MDIPTEALSARARRPRGFCVMLTGLSGAGKSALSRELARLWEERVGEGLSVLDGDEARETLCSELGFSKEHRDLNVARLAFVAGLIARHGGGAIIAAICPYRGARELARERLEAQGSLFCEVWVSTPLSVCEERDPKGLYRRARAGALAAFTGVSDPYEEPPGADLRLDLSRLSPREAALQVADWLADRLRD